MSYTDHQGNEYHPTKDQLLLIKGGWQLVEKRKRGMIRIIKWRHPDTTEVWPQGVALQIEELRKTHEENWRKLLPY